MQYNFNCQPHSYDGKNNSRLFLLYKNCLYKTTHAIHDDKLLTQDFIKHTWEIYYNINYNVTFYFLRSHYYKKKIFINNRN